MSASNRATARYFVPNCQALRVRKGKNIADLARSADVSRDTISKKIEKRQPVTEAVAHAVFNALNDWYGDSLDRAVEIVEARTD